ncbi:MAG: type IX secretion system protein PorQ [Melioribacteraceae bacterium]|nr:type IX secretion system protein PorQ [Melioribacteraceae bacterium]
MLKKGLYILLLTAGLSSAQSTFEFLKLDTSPRAASLAGSYVANADDPNVIFYNPAGIYALEGKPISFSYFKHLLDINTASVSYSQEFEGLGRFGAAVIYMNYGSFTEADNFGNKTGEFSASDMAVMVGYAGRLDNNFYYGANVKFIYSGIQDYYSTGLAADLGVQYLWVEQGWKFGLSALNIGSQIAAYFNKFEQLPLDIRLGFSKKLQHMPFEFFFSFNRLNEEEDRFSKITAGGEFRLSSVIRLRFGYNSESRKELKVGTTAGLAGFNFGLGIYTKGYQIDYALSSLGAIGEMHRFGVSTSL